MTSRVGPLAQGVVRYVWRTRQDVVIGDTSTDERFASASCLRRAPPNSVPSLPVAHQGHLSGILYLQHALSGAFTPARTEIVRVLATQTAISFENAQLYNEMKQEAAKRQRAEELLRALTEGTASATGPSISSSRWSVIWRRRSRCDTPLWPSAEIRREHGPVPRVLEGQGFRGSST